MQIVKRKFKDVDSGEIFWMSGGEPLQKTDREIISGENVINAVSLESFNLFQFEDDVIVEVFDADIDVLHEYELSLKEELAKK
ncbi:hypothetical protein [uncultured Pseudoramibacter sp.]|uniref:hypothetical protein n=1 Tax=uncultured Pseudoramibacter sp. TaxID=1623493 RepID=UPI0025F00F72|nr:hypothetical protein [uncultured Pseudoramibacter sp.]